MEDMSSENQTTDEVLPFSTTSLMDLLQDFSQMSTIRVVLGYVLMVSNTQVRTLSFICNIAIQSNHAKYVIHFNQGLYF